MSTACHYYNYKHIESDPESQPVQVLPLTSNYPISTDKPTVLILCTGNSCRSHLAEDILKQAASLLEV